MDTVQVSARPRLLSGSDVARKVRRAGLLPANLHGNGQPARSIATDPQTVRRGLQGAYGRNQIFEVTVAGDAKSVLAIAREVQFHPVSRQLEHVDFLVVQADSNIEVTLPVVLSGRSAGQKVGGRLEHITRYIKVACTPSSLPKLVEIDVTPYELGFVMGIADLKLPAGVTAVYKRPFKIFEIQTPKAELSPAAAAEEKKK